MAETKTISVKIKYSGGELRCYNPVNDPKTAQAALNAGVPINGFTNPGGSSPGFGYFLLLKEYLFNIENEENLSVVISDGTNNVEINNLLMTETSRFAPNDTSNAMVLVKLEDYRCLAYKFPQYVPEAGLDSATFFAKNDIFPEFRSTVTDDVQDAFRTLWEYSNTTVPKANLDFTESTLVSGVKDVLEANHKHAWHLFHELLTLMSNRLYKLNDKFTVTGLGKTNSNNANAALVSDNDRKLVQLKRDEAKTLSFLPEKLNVTFRRIKSTFPDLPYVKQETYSGSKEKISNTIKDFYVHNVFYPLFNTTSEFDTLAGILADNFFAAYDNHNKYDGVYFGLIPFVPGPDADLIEYWHDIPSNTYYTRIESIDLKEVMMSYFDEDFKVPIEPTVRWVQAPEAGIPAATENKSENRVTPGEAVCNILVRAEEDASPVVTKDLYIKSEDTLTILNYTDQEVSGIGVLRRVQVSGHYDGAEVIGGGGAGDSMVLACMDEDMEDGAEGLATVYDKAQSPPVATAQQVTVKNDWWGGKISNDVKIAYIEQGGTKRVHWAGCEPPSDVQVGD